MTVSATLDKTVRLYRANFKPLFIISALAGLLQLPLALMMGGVAEDGTPKGGWLIYMGLAGLASLLAWPLNYGSLGTGAVAAVAGRPISVADAFRNAFRCFFPLLGAGIVAGLCTLVGTLLLIVPGFYIFLGLAFTSLVIVDERPGVFPALRRSWALADGQRGLVFWTLFGWGVLHVVLSYALGSLLRMFGIDASAAPVSQQLAQILVAPCYALSLMLVIDEVRTRREGQDLVLEAQRLAAGSDNAAAAPGPASAGPPPAP